MGPGGEKEVQAAVGLRPLGERGWVEVWLIPDLGARLVGEGAEEAREFRVAEVEEAARDAGQMQNAAILRKIDAACCDVMQNR